MSEPIPEQMAALFVVRPVRQNGFRRHDGVNQEQPQHGRAGARDKENSNGESRQRDTENRGSSDQPIMTGLQTEHSPAEQRFLVRLKDDRGGIDGDGRHHGAAAPSEGAIPRILRRHHRAKQGHSVPNAKRNHDVRCGKEHPAHLFALAVR